MNRHKFKTVLGTVKQERRDPLDMIMYGGNNSCVYKLLGDISFHRRTIIKRILQKWYVTKSKWIEVAQDRVQELVL
jgi:hypothetical protein